ncbi:unconventional myosin IC-like [Paramacrobiotus metropolitanus]|uniref:unconventional myosin IC-like n=1 Tax=Paramacrobiotus metropolitanus TaxID=2943436 RepID=UPI0024460644|nr:unconventional myosin IC-like [Paramacrobiotus metropolitanus]
MENSIQNRETVGVEDFVLLENYRSEDAFVENLRKRFQEDLIYTYIGSVLVSINPYKELPIYDAKHMERYRGQNFYELPPHIFAVADTAYRAVVHEYKDECIMISGESGSGKTEATKKILQYIAQASRHSGTVDDVKDKLLACNPLFEAFGNARTTRNDNSSRFGKYMDVEIGVEGFPIGGHVLDYLLERTRVVFQAPGEQNFHVFYQLLKGADQNLLSRLKLSGNWKDYHYLNQGCRTESTQISQEDALNKRWLQEFREIIHAFDATHFTPKEISDLFTTVAAILHLGNVQFMEDGDYAEMKSAEEVVIVSELLGCSRDDLMQALTHRGVHARQEKVLAKFNREQATTSRDSLAKAVYAKTFQWLIQRVNQALQASNQSRSAVIGLLDIYGFEVFERNSFEQFCINYCNEKLQQLFIELTLRSEQEEYVAENIPWEQVEYFDNQIICALIEAKPVGIIPLLDDECLRPGNATDATFLEKLREKHTKHPHLLINRDKQQFTIKHYAGNVIYDVEGFLDKNGELLHRDLKEIIIRCRNNDILKNAFTNEEATSLKRALSTATQFKNSLKELTVILKSKDPFYVRCIRPNDHKASRNFSDTIVRHQVKYLGLMENLRVRRAGYAYRRSYDAFLRRYKSLCPDTWPHYNGPAREGVSLLLNYLQTPAKAYAMGVTKLFVRMPQTIFAIEDAFQERKNDLVTKIIALWRGRRQRQAYLRDREDIITAQNAVRRFLAVKLLNKRRVAARSLREFIKGFMERHGPMTDLNRKFWLQTRMVYLNKLAKMALPVSVLDKSWPTPPPFLKETSDLLRSLHMRNRVLKYVKHCSPERKFLMDEKVLAERLFKGKKTLYLSSIPQFFITVRLGAETKPFVEQFENSIRQPTEKTVYATDCRKWDRHGLKERNRAMVITTQNLYFLEPGKAGFKKKNAFPLYTVDKLTVSANRDSVLILTVTTPAQGKKPEQTNDYIFLLPNLIEFAMKFVLVSGKESIVEVVPNGRCAIKAGGQNGCAVDFGLGSVDNILGHKKILIVQSST